jgi:hypothetical protein
MANSSFEIKKANNHLAKFDTTLTSQFGFPDPKYFFFYFWL